MRNLVLFAVAALFIAGAATNLAEKFEGAPKASRNAGANSASGGNPQPQAAANLLAVRSDRNGHFAVDGNIGGRSVKLLVDTGASVVALTSIDAERLGLYPAPRDYTVKIQTANGTVRAARVQLAALKIGPLVVHDVVGVVMPEGALAQNLLGMSFLSRLRRFEFRTGQLLLEQ